jgi:hypothetical protein
MPGTTNIDPADAAILFPVSNEQGGTDTLTSYESAFAGITQAQKDRLHLLALYIDSL